MKKPVSRGREWPLLPRETNRFEVFSFLVLQSQKLIGGVSVARLDKLLSHAETMIRHTHEPLPHRGQRLILCQVDCLPLPSRASTFCRHIEREVRVALVRCHQSVTEERDSVRDDRRENTGEGIESATSGDKQITDDDGMHACPLHGCISAE